MVNVAGAIHRVVNSPEVETLRSVPMIRSSHAAASRCIRGPIRIITQQITQTEVAGYSRLLSDVAQGVPCDLDPRRRLGSKRRITDSVFFIVFF